MKAKTPYLLVGGAFVIAVLALSGGFSVIRKQCVRSFDIRSCVPPGVSLPRVTVLSVRAASEELYFLIRPRDGTGECMALRTGLQGDFRSLYRLGSRHIADFDVDVRRLVTAVKNDSIPSSFVQVSASGETLGVTPSDVYIERLFRISGQLYGYVPDRATPRVVHLDSSFKSGDAITLTLQAPLGVPLIAPLPDGRIAIAERRGPTVGVWRLSSSSADSSFVPVAPGMPTLRGGSRPAMGNLIADIAAAPDGALYIIPGHYKMADGLPTFKFGLDGALVEAQRLMLPMFEDETSPQSNPEGYMSPFRIAVVGEFLVAISDAGKVAVYTL